MSFSFLRLFKKRYSPIPASVPDVSVSKVVASVPGDVRFPFCAITLLELTLILYT